MSNNKYNELLEKYYQGSTSVAEERWLKKEAPHLQQSLPSDVLQKHSHSMDWSFENMLQQASRQSGLQTVTKSPVLHWMKYAAAVALLIIPGITMYYYRQPVNKDINVSTAYISPVAFAKEDPGVKDTASHNKVTLKAPEETNETNRLKTKYKTASRKAATPTQQNDDFFVTVAGKRITDENEALAILQQSFNKISGDVQETMTNIHQSPKLNVKFK